MPNSRPLTCDKSELNSGSTIGFIFHANHEELEEVQSKQNDALEESNEDKTDKLIPESLTGAKAGSVNNEITDAARDQRTLFGKRSISIDSAYESPFSNPIETWKKLNVLKEKITKTVEGKILEMKMDRNVLSKSSHGKLIHSKENSSISDSEDTSESSKMSEQCKDAENQSFIFDQLSNENVDANIHIPNIQALDNVTKETESKENENEPRNRKNFLNIPELINLPDIKIATAKNDVEGSFINSSFSEDVESGVEADENLDATEEESIDFFEGEIPILEGEGGGGGNEGKENKEGGGGGGGEGISQQSSSFERINNFLHVLDFFTSRSFSKKNTAILLFGFVLYFFFPLSEFIRGFLLSLLLILFWESVKNYVQFEETSHRQRPFVIPNYKSMPPLKVPLSKSVKGIWFNEYEKEVYDPDFYSVTQTVPVYLELEDKLLKISRSKGKISRRATYDEPEYKLQFVSQRIYNISGCNVYLMPDGLTRKRLFSKKYPIVIFLRPGSFTSEKKSSKEVEEKELLEGDETESSSINRSESPRNKSALYLFARCDRQKEEWYRRLLAATKFTSFDSQKNENISEAAEDKDNYTEKTSLDDSPSKEPSTPFENLFFDDEVAQLEEYLRYMSNFVDVEVIHHETKVKPHSSWYGKLKLKKKDAHNQEDDLEPVYSRNTFIGPNNKKIRKDFENFSNFPVSKTKVTHTSVNSEGNEEKKHEDTSYSNQAQWFSAFVNRILFDVFRSPYWLSKIRNKVQRKLNSIRLPYYIEEIEVIEMDLGKTGPTFHRVSQPYLDDLGLWFDMDLTFDGLIKLTIQTHLNLIKLQKGMEENEEAETQVTGKPKKGKKKQRIEKESKDSFLIKDSKENFKESVNEKNKILAKNFTKRSPLKMEKKDCQLLKDNSNEENKSSQAPHCKFIDEVSQLAEIAFEENLNKIKEKPSEFSINCPSPDSEKKRSPIYDSELEDSAESSDEDEEEEEAAHPVLQSAELEEQQPQSSPRRYPRTRKSSKKIFKVFENVAQSKYFRSMAQSKYIQKAIAGVSAAKLRLTLEIKSCTGILTVNIPPPPSDRFWYGFRKMPTLVFSANPKIGDKTVRFIHIKNYLQKKILHELKTKAVLPNMIGFVCSALVREEMSPTFVNVPRFPKAFGKKVMVSPNMIDFILPTSTPTQSSSFLPIEEPDLQEATLSE